MTEPTEVKIPLPKTLRIKSEDANPQSMRFEDPETGEKVEGIRMVSLQIPPVTNQTGFIEAHVVLYVDLDITVDAVPVELVAHGPGGLHMVYRLSGESTCETGRCRVAPK